MIPLIRPQIPNPVDTLKYWRESEIAGQYTNFGPLYEKLSRQLSFYSGRKAVPVTNGTAAITIALLTTCEIGSRVAVPNFTVPATIQAVLSAGMIPVILPTDEKTWCISPAALADKKDCYDVFIVVSPFGYFVDVAQYEAIARNCEKKIVYDFAGAWGQFPETDFPVTYSFHATKNFAIGEGGCVTFSSDEDVLIARSSINFGYLPGRTIKQKFCQNAKLDELRCAVALAVLEKYDDIKNLIDRKRLVYRRYLDALSEFMPIEGISLYRVYGGAPSLCVFRFPNMARCIEENSPKHGFLTRQYYEPVVNKFEAFRDVVSFVQTDCFFEHCCALPSAPTDPEFLQIVSGMKDLYTRWDREYAERHKTS